MTSEGTPSRATSGPPPLANLDGFGTSDHFPLLWIQDNIRKYRQSKWTPSWQLNAVTSAPGDTAVVLIAAKRYDDLTF